jgi:hypothetical protein
MDVRRGARAVCGRRDMERCALCDLSVGPLASGFNGFKELIESDYRDCYGRFLLLIEEMLIIELANVGRDLRITNQLRFASCQLTEHVLLPGAMAVRPN